MVSTTDFLLKMVTIIGTVKFFHFTFYIKTIEYLK